MVQVAGELIASLSWVTIASVRAGSSTADLVSVMALNTDSSGLGQDDYIWVLDHMYRHRLVPPVFMCSRITALAKEKSGNACLTKSPRASY